MLWSKKKRKRKHCFGKEKQKQFVQHILLIWSEILDTHLLTYNKVHPCYLKEHNLNITEIALITIPNFHKIMADSVHAIVI